MKHWIECAFCALYPALYPEPSHVSVLQERTEIIEKAVDCLRIVTTGSDVNKRALVEISIAVPTLVGLLSGDPSKARPKPSVAC